MQILVLALAMVFIAVPVSATTIDTTTSDGGFISGLSSLGGAFGQTFTVTGVDTRLDRFSLFLEGFQPGTDRPMALRGLLAEWDNTLSRPGPVLFQSDIRFAILAGLQEFAFTPDLALITDHRYVAYLSTFGLESQPRQIYDVKLTREDVLPGENLVIGVLSGPWSAFPGGLDMWFKAQLSPVAVPEPMTLLLVAIGIAAAAVARRLRFV